MKAKLSASQIGILTSLTCGRALTLTANPFYDWHRAG